MWGNHIHRAALGLILVVVLCPPVVSQEVASIQATATVVSSLTVSGTVNLDFGSVTPGVPKTIDKNAVGSAGEFQITGNAGAEVSLNFTLPSQLNSGGANMTVSFSSTDASWDDGTGGGQTAPSGIFNPNAGSNVNLGAGGGLDIWLGGSVTPTVSQTGGSYSGTVTLTVAYTGN